ncbi:hypothetical protein ACCS67_01260 [Rhizobium brockwellii]|uniref:hypothetical protein n=1 Tax=Rhizobium brockwellii TaxID=3019932 RepID=UPI003F96AE3A
MFPRGDTAQNATNFGIPKRGNFGIPKWDFFFMATLMRLLAAISPRHQLEESESVGGSPIMTLPPQRRLRRSKLQFILVDCFVCKLIVEAKGRVLGSNPECSIYRSTNSIDRHISAPGASIPALEPGCQHRP